MRPRLLASLLARTRLELTNAISIPEKNAESIMAIRVIIIAAEVLIDLLFLLRFYGVGRQRIAVLASEFLHRENAHRTFKFIYCHPFVRAETVSFENPVGTLDVDKRVGAHFLVALVPENLLGKYSLVVHVENCHVTVEAPKLVGIELRYGIGLY